MRRGPALIVPALILALPAAAQTKGEAEALVKKAVAFAKAKGVAKALHEINEPAGPFRHGELYLFVYDLNGVVVAHGGNAGMIGKNLMNTRDGDGELYVLKLVNLAKTKGGGWLSYQFPNPVNHQIEPKLAYVELYDGLIFGSGIYRK